MNKGPTSKLYHWALAISVAGSGSSSSSSKESWRQVTPRCWLFAYYNSVYYFDAHPLPNINALVDTISKYKVFSAVDLKSAYHQIP